MSWFTIDFVSVLPFDMAASVLKDSGGDQTTVQTLDNLKIVRVVKGTRDAPPNHGAARAALPTERPVLSGTMEWARHGSPTNEPAPRRTAAGTPSERRPESLVVYVASADLLAYLRPHLRLAAQACG